ncbi:MAG: rhomboid family intramembrane serine protease, partial [Geobacteraceae bacterium]|nr:rhomboid family intramembrane serine protease [Geobacteraceae bacterium]
MFWQEYLALLITMESDAEVIDAGREPWRAVPSDLRDVSLATVSLSRRRAALWALVLESRSVPCRVEQEGGCCILLVPAEFFASALLELRVFEEENHNWPPLASDATPLVENTLSTLSVLLLLATFHNLTRLNIPLF